MRHKGKKNKSEKNGMKKKNEIEAENKKWLKR